jgi:hypothetical protein
MSSQEEDIEEQWERTIVAFTSPYSLKDLCVPATSSETITNDIFKIRVASTADRLDKANDLIRKKYAWRGYKVDGLEIQPNYVTLIAYATHDSIVGTMTLGIDSDSGLSVDKTFKPEIDGLRSEGRKIAEITKLASETEFNSEQARAVLIHLIYIYARNIHGCTDFLIEINPRHVDYYRKRLGFQALGDQKFCERVDAPAQLMHIDLSYMSSQIELFGGLGGTNGGKSLYPYFLSTNDEIGITKRLLRGK